MQRKLLSTEAIMQSKIKGIAWLALPVIAIALAAPGARRFVGWRAQRAVPRIASFELRAPTPAEARLGADVGYTARLVVPDSGGPFWSHRIVFSNAAGARWKSGTPAWNRTIVAGRERAWDNPDFTAAGNADNRNGITVELTGGCKWRCVAGPNENLQAEIALWPNDGWPVPQIKASRVFALSAPRRSP